MTFWTDEKIETMRQMALEGKSASEIGAVLGCTRNAVIGKMHRGKHRFSPRPNKRPASSIFRKPYTRRAKEAVQADPVLDEGIAPICLVEFVPEFPAGRGVSIIDVTGCKWAVGFDHTVYGGHTFCNAATVDGRSYCPHHAEMNVASYSAALIKKTIKVAMKAGKGRAA